MSEQVKLLIAYDVHAGQENAYRRFIVEEFLPKAQELGLTPTDAWHTAYGRYPSRLLGLVAEDLAAVQRARNTPQWRDLMRQLEGYAVNLTQRVVPFHGGFQW